MTRSIIFRKAASNEDLRPGHVICSQQQSRKAYLRVTHVFARSVYLMMVSTAPAARYARRPYPRDIVDLQSDLSSGLLELGRIDLPEEFATTPGPGTTEHNDLQQRKELIRPLLDLFAIERNLHRAFFTAAIESRANTMHVSEVSLRRLLLRYWYFGGVEQALANLTPGPACSDVPMSLSESFQKTPRRRAGAKPRLSKNGYPEITFVPTQDDFADMVSTMAKLARQGRTTWVASHEKYLATVFAQKHPQVYESYCADKTLCPVTVRQFTRIVKREQQFTADLRANTPKISRHIEERALHSTGPGDVYEIDATKGQIYLVAANDPTRIVGTPTIYILIDRWSRFIVAIYITLYSPSWQSLRMLLRIAFTSREERFKPIGFLTSDERWPLGVVPAQLATDRGSEMISEQMLATAVEGLRIEPLVLPPETPDGKAIVERVIRTLKEDLSSDGTPGTYDKGILGRDERRQRKKARSVAVLNLQHLYRTLLDHVDDYNHSPHRTLESVAALKAACVPPTPAAAYTWGLSNLTGVQRPPLTDHDYFRLTLDRAQANLSNGVLRFGKYRYFPVNEAARRLASRSTASSVSHQVGIDRLQPTHIYSMNHRDSGWPQWEIEPAGRVAYRDLLLEEEEFRREEHAILRAQSQHDSVRNRVSKGSRKHIGLAAATKQTKPSASAASGDSHETDRMILGMRSVPQASNLTPRDAQEERLRMRELAEAEEFARLARASGTVDKQ